MPLLLSGLSSGFWPVDGRDWATVLRGRLFGFGSLLIFYMLGGIGTGDVKLLAGVGAWLGMPLTFHVFLAASLAAGMYAVAVLSFTTGWVKPSCTSKFPGYG